MNRPLSATRAPSRPKPAEGGPNEVDLQDQPSRGTGQVSFSGHETFTLRHGWLKKAVEAVAADAQIFANDDAMVALGVGKNMVRSIRHWALATDTIEEISGTRGADLRVTSFGELIFGSQGADPFLEDINTLWLIHWKLATNERRSTGWSWLLSLLRTDEFTRDSLSDLFKSELKRRNLTGPSDSSLRRDIDCALRTYLGTRAKGELLEESLECPLVELQLMTADADGVLFRFNRGPKPSISDQIFLYCLLEFWRARGSGDSLAFSEIAFAANSPGAVFKLDENTIASRLERLNDLTRGSLIYDETSGLKQVYRRANLSAQAELNRHYQESLATVGD
jgi:Protein of unknown function (DUF4007)